MPRIRLTKSAIDSLRTSKSDVVYWDAGYPGFCVKVTPKGRKVFIVLYRTGGAGSKLRKYTIGPYGGVSLQQARAAAPEGFARGPGGSGPAWPRRRCSPRGSKGGIQQPRNATPNDGSWQIVSRICLRPSLPNVCQ